MDEIDKYEESLDEVDSSEKSSRDESTSEDSQDTVDEDDEPIWNTAKSDKFVKGDPFKYTKVVHPYPVPTIRENKQNYIATLKPYTDEVKDTIIDALKASLKGVTVLTSAVDDDNFSSLIVDDNILPLAVVDDNLAAVDAYFAEEVDEEDTK
ncbi:hypothetical protein EJD97_000633 [Solanum chilense]|uniref:Uncharacterized protein n=1 Tax=Solanum chilense TaxID=4083 RepID=A0A6N2C6D1_SOLCI|nr:hypothetical protein EJD97_000633 [Solanum chilense]